MSQTSDRGEGTGGGRERAARMRAWGVTLSRLSAALNPGSRLSRLVLESAVAQLASRRAAGSGAIVRSTIALGLKVVAEGIEDTKALAAVAAFGCDYAQGYHFSRPVPADAFTTWVRAQVESGARPLLAP